MLPSTCQMVVSTGAARLLWNAGGSAVITCNPAGRGMLINSSTVAGTIPAPKFCPLIMFFPTAPTSGSCPVFTGQRSEPGFVTISGAAAAGCSIACTPRCTPQAVLICAETAVETVLSELTSVMGAPPLPPSPPPFPLGVEPPALLPPPVELPPLPLPPALPFPLPPEPG